MKPILLPGPTDPRFWIALWGLVIAGVVGLVALAIAKELVDQEIDTPWTLPDEDDDGLTEPWFA